MCIPLLKKFEIKFKKIASCIRNYIVLAFDESILWTSIPRKGNVWGLWVNHAFIVLKCLLLLGKGITCSFKISCSKQIRPPKVKYCLAVNFGNMFSPVVNNLSEFFTRKTLKGYIYIHLKWEDLMNLCKIIGSWKFLMSLLMIECAL